jgi:hypothetical protein
MVNEKGFRDGLFEIEEKAFVVIRGMRISFEAKTGSVGINIGLLVHFYREINASSLI